MCVSTLRHQFLQGCQLAITNGQLMPFLHPHALFNLRGKANGSGEGKKKKKEGCKPYLP